MPFSGPTGESFQTTTERLLKAAGRCRRLAASITDRRTCESLLQIAKECEERAAELRDQAIERTSR